MQYIYSTKCSRVFQGTWVFLLAGGGCAGRHHLCVFSFFVVCLWVKFWWCILMYVCMDGWMYVCVYACMCLCMCARGRVHVHVHVCVCACVSVCVCACACVYRWEWSQTTAGLGIGVECVFLLQNVSAYYKMCVQVGVKPDYCRARYWWQRAAAEGSSSAVCVYVYTDVCMYTCIYTYVYIRIYIHTYVCMYSVRLLKAPLLR